MSGEDVSRKGIKNNRKESRREQIIENVCREVVLKDNS
jgi:hypothetical protein